MGDFPFNIADVAALLPIGNQRRKNESIDADCPFCGKQRKLNLNFVHNVFRCNYCREQGGMLDLYLRFRPELRGRPAAYRALCEDLRVGYSVNARVPEQTHRPAQPQGVSLAMPWELHKTYTVLFSMLGLSAKHREDLLKRGLTEEQIARFGYRSTPAFGFQNLAGRVRQSGCVVEGIPGFYLDEEDRWAVRFHARCSGIVIPILNPAGQIQGAQIRLDHPFDGRKYIWFSSAEMKRGVSSGSPVHFAGPVGKTLCLTEGGLKGTIAHCLTGQSFACIAGAGQYANFMRCFPILRERGVEEIAVAYDMDLLTNEMVRKACGQILQAADAAGFRTRQMQWDPVNKGIDDHYWAETLKQLLPEKIENELRTRGSLIGEAIACAKICEGIRENGIASKTLAFLYFMEQPLEYLLRKSTALASFRELMAAVEQDISKDF